MRDRKRRRLRPAWVALVFGLVLLGVALGTALGYGIHAFTAAREASASGAARSDAAPLPDESAYPEKLAELYYRNPDARQFVLDYPEKRDADPAIDLTAEAQSDTVPLLMQWDERWGYRSYNDSLMGLSGCGPTCLSMVLLYLKHDAAYSPWWTAQYAEEHGYAVPGSGTSWTLMSEGAPALGIDVTEIPWDEQRILANLDAGNPIVCVVGPGDFTTDGHYIVLVGAEDGKIRVNDPNSYANSNTLWTLETLENQVLDLWVMR